MTIEIITPFGAQRVSAWYERAWNDPQTSRFLSAAMSREISTVSDSDWTSLILMDDENNGLARVLPARGASSHYTDICVWVLPSAGKLKPWIAGNLIRRAFYEAHYRFGSKYAEWGVHASNKDSMRFSERHGQQYSFKQDASWDSYLGKWVGQACFYVNLQEYFKSDKEKQDETRSQLQKP